MGGVVVEQPLARYKRRRFLLYYVAFMREKHLSHFLSAKCFVDDPSFMDHIDTSQNFLRKRIAICMGVIPSYQQLFMINLCLCSVGWEFVLP